MTRAYLWVAALGLAGCVLSGCERRPSPAPGERLARTYCAACHVFPEPSLLDKRSWQQGVLPQMAPRLGVPSNTLFDGRFRNPNLSVLNVSLDTVQWAQIVAYYRDAAPDSLPPQALPAAPELDPDFFAVGPFVPHLQSSGIVTLLEVDSVHRRVYVGEAVTNTLRVLDWDGRVRATVTLGSPPTGIITDGDRVLVLESGILDPNDEPKGSLVQYDRAGDSLRFRGVVLDSLYRPVYVRQTDLDGDGVPEFVVCEFGNNIGRLAVYKAAGSRYTRQVLAETPGAIRVEVRDLTGDGKPDVVALFAQGDERIVLFENDGAGHFGRERILARFPPVYGSMFFTFRDMNGDGVPDIVYVNGDNFDYSRVLKPYHGVRILENDGHNQFRERYFYPIYGAAQAVVADFDGDGRPDLMVASNFADQKAHPERGIVYLANAGGYHFRPYVFSAAAGNQWNLMAAVNLEGNGRPDLLVGAMNLATVARVQQRFTRNPTDSGSNAMLLFRNRFKVARQSAP